MYSSIHLTTHHVGGRDGHGPFPLPDLLSADAPIVYYEADSNAINGMVSGGRPTTAISKCVGKSAGRVIFNITLKPHASSLLVVSPKYEKAYFHKANEEPIWGVTFRVARTIEIDTDSLDSIVASGKYEVQPPDILTLDTEGTEYEIIEGASALLESEIVCVVAEVAFVPIREGQKLFGDVSALLAKKGFIPVQILQHKREMSLYRAPVGLRGRGIQAFADAVFLKDPDVAVTQWDKHDTVVKLRKLAIAALAYGQLEYALDCLARAHAYEPPKVPSKPKYWTFLDALEHCTATVKPKFLPVPGEIGDWSSESEARRDGKDAAKSVSGVKSLLKRHLVRSYKVFLLLMRGLVALRYGWRSIKYITLKYFGLRSPVEKLLKEYGFGKLSDEVRELRLRQSPFILSGDVQHGRRPAVR